MIFEALSAPIAADADMTLDLILPAPAHCAPALLLPADPEPGWASANPDKALLFLFVSPRDCTAVDELLALPA